VDNAPATTLQDVPVMTNVMETPEFAKVEDVSTDAPLTANVVLDFNAVLAVVAFLPVTETVTVPLELSVSETAASLDAVPSMIVEVVSPALKINAEE